MKKFLLLIVAAIMFIGAGEAMAGPSVPVDLTSWSELTLDFPASDEIQG